MALVKYILVPDRLYGFDDCICMVCPICFYALFQYISWKCNIISGWKNILWLDPTIEAARSYFQLTVIRGSLMLDKTTNCCTAGSNGKSAVTCRPHSRIKCQTDSDHGVLIAGSNIKLVVITSYHNWFQTHGVNMPIIPYHYTNLWL